MTMSRRSPTPTSDTVPQRQLEALLNELGFDVETETLAGTFFLDCYVRELHMGFEADGPTHDVPKQRQHDAYRDHVIWETHRVPILRVKSLELEDWDKGLATGLLDRVLGFIDSRDDAEARRAEGNDL
ncbi:hypothetical protein LCGC14_2685450 [marine sediment metagenome]|uniref:DUF559 domain-containing protein n=1 Tax=marine sediment metagenome TaxID=412755 RepID=A0A0F9A7L2_9ZZZZ